jgi:argininosuccinate synthase
MMNNTRIVQLFSGGVHAEDAVRVLSETHTVVTLTLDIGQAHELTGVRERALQSGASRAHVLDVREDLARNYFCPAVQAGRDVVASPGEILAPLFAAKLVELAEIENAAAVAHEWSGDDAARLEDAVKALAPEIPVLAPISAGELSACDEPTLWSSPRVPVDGSFELTRNAADAPAEGATIEITFAAGVPERLNGIEMSLVEIIESLETLAGVHGVGRVLLDGHSCVEAPAAAVLGIAYTSLNASAPDGPLDGTVTLRLRKGDYSDIRCAHFERRSMESR